MPTADQYKRIAEALNGARTAVYYPGLSWKAAKKAVEGVLQWGSMNRTVPTESGGGTESSVDAPDWNQNTFIQNECEFPD